jgi:pyruvate/2-oxoglutarate dehydrogenase complex dihydrolipoamide acyltransferase (E2) component
MPDELHQSTSPTYKIISYPRSRQAIVHYLAVARQKPAIHGLFEVDITMPRKIFAAHKARTGVTLSLTGYLIKCLAQAVDENKVLHAYRKGRNRLVVFDDVDITTLVERQVGEHRIAAPYIIRSANRKSFLEIHREIRTVQTHDPSGHRLMDRYGWVPGFLVRLFWHVLGSNPHWKKQVSGTVSVTAVGMFGQGAGWGITISEYTLSVVVGGIGVRPVLVEGAVGGARVPVPDHQHGSRGGRRWTSGALRPTAKELMESGWG